MPVDWVLFANVIHWLEYLCVQMYANVIEMWHKVLLQLAVRFLSNKVLQMKSVQNSDNIPSSSLNPFFSAKKTLTKVYGIGRKMAKKALSRL